MCTAGKRMKFATKLTRHYHLTLGMLPHYLGKLKIKIFCRYSADIADMQTNCILIASNFASRFPYWLQIKKFQFTVVLFIYFRDQFVALEIRHSRRHGRLSTINMVWNDANKILIKIFIWNQYEEKLTILNTENIKSCGWTTKLEAIKTQYVCISATVSYTHLTLPTNREV